MEDRKDIKIAISKSECKHRIGESSYNHNIYELPFLILMDKCEAMAYILEVYHEGEGYTENQIGIMRGGNFVRRFYLNTDSTNFIDDEIFLIDNSLIDIKKKKKQR